MGWSGRAPALSAVKLVTGCLSLLKSPSARTWARGWSVAIREWISAIWIRSIPAGEGSLFADAEHEFPVPSNHFPVPPKVFFVRSSREFNQKAQSTQAVRAPRQSQQYPESRKFPVFSLDNSEFRLGEWFAGDCPLRHPPPTLVSEQATTRQPPGTGALFALIPIRLRFLRSSLRGIAARIAAASLAVRGSVEFRCYPAINREFFNF